MSKKKAKSATQEIPLDPAWIDADAAAAAGALGAAGSAAGALIQRWVVDANAQALSGAAGSDVGAHRKAAKRGLQVLKSRGVTVPKAQPERQPSSTAAPSSAVEGWMCTPGPLGSLVLALTRRQSSGAQEICVVTFSPDGYLSDVDSGSLKRSAVDRFFAELRPSVGSDRIRVPTEWVRFRIGQARARHAQDNRVEPMGFARAAALLEPTPEQPPPHPFDEEGFEVDEADAISMAADSASLHSLPEFVRWLPQREAVVELLAAVGQSFGDRDPSTLGDDETAGEFASAIDEATDSYFTPERRLHVAGWMKDSAVSVLASHGEEKALLTAATLKAVEQQSAEAPAHTIPFLRVFFEKALRIIAFSQQAMPTA